MENRTLAHIRTKGNAAPKYQYDAFGNQRTDDATDPNPFRYCGEYYDKELGEVYLRARQYDPRTGRFTSEDPAKDGGNWYAYCASNPVGKVDPSGQADVLLDYIAAKNNGDISYEVIEQKSLFGLTTTYSVEVTSGEDKVTYDCRWANGHPVVNSDDLVRDFGLEYSRVEHQANADLFDSADDAALAWALMNYEKSNREGVEYGALINRKEGPLEDRRYAFGDTTGGDSSSVAIPGAAPNGFTRVGGIHSHPGWLNGRFSGSWILDDLLNAAQDYDWMRSNPGETLYMTAGQGHLLAGSANTAGDVTERLVNRNITNIARALQVPVRQATRKLQQAQKTNLRAKGKSITTKNAKRYKK